MTEMKTRVKASTLITRPTIRVTLEKSAGTATGFDPCLSRMRRFLEYQLARFLLANKLTGQWALLAYVSREAKH